MRVRKIRNRNNNIIAYPSEPHFRPTTPGLIDLTRTQPPIINIPTPTTFRQTTPLLTWVCHGTVVNSAPVQRASHVRVVDSTPGCGPPHVQVLHNAPSDGTHLVRGVSHAPYQNASPHVRVNKAPHMGAANNAPIHNARHVGIPSAAPFCNPPVDHLPLQATLARLHQAYNPNQPNPYITLPLWGTPRPQPEALKWTDAEDTFLQSIVNHSPLPWAYIMKMLPYRGKSAVMQRLGKLKALTKSVRQELDLVLSAKEVEVIVIDDDVDAGAGVANVGSGDRCGGGDGGERRDGGSEQHNGGSDRRDGSGERRDCSGNDVGVVNGSGNNVVTRGDIGERAGVANSSDEQQRRVQNDGTAVIEDAGRDASGEAVKSVEGGQDSVDHGNEGGEELNRNSSGEAQEERIKKVGERVIRSDAILEVCQRAVEVEHIPDREEREESDDEGLIGAQRVAEVLNEESGDDMEAEEEFVFAAAPHVKYRIDKKETLINREKGEDCEKQEQKIYDAMNRKRESEVGEYDERKRRKKDEVIVVS